MTSTARTPAMRLKYLATIVATAIVVLFLLVSALPLMHWFEQDGRSVLLAENQTLWDSLNIDSYRFTVEQRCDCGPGDAGPLAVTVVNDTVLALRSDDGVEAPLPQVDWPATVPRLFARIETAIMDEVDGLEVTYDDTYGLPREVLIDPDRRFGGDEIELPCEQLRSAVAKVKRAPAKIVLVVTALIGLGGCAGQVDDAEPIVYSDEWFRCESRFQCVVVYDAYCRSVAVNRRSAIVYQDWALQQVELAGERRLCPRTDEISPIAACLKARCTYPIPLGRGQ